MKRKHKILIGILSSLLAIGLIAGTIIYVNQPPFYDTVVPDGALGIARQVPPAEPWLQEYDEFPTYNPADMSSFQINLCGLDLKQYDLSARYNDISFGMYDTTTVWPEKMPAGFAPANRLEMGLNPGLGVSALHTQGINGAGTSIAIIDRILFTQHEEYRGNLKHYEEIHVPGIAQEPEMHGAAVSSLAVGQNIGVAPEADLYYIAVWPYDGFDRYDLSYYATAIDRVIEINKNLPENNKIRVISISDGFQNGNGRSKMLAAIDRAKADNIFVITTSLRLYYDFGFAGLDRAPEGDADRLDSYSVGVFEKKQAEKGAEWLENSLFVPMDSRTYASCTGEDVYEYSRISGLSWCAPYLAGLYALAVQVNPQITPEQFWQTAIATADRLEVKNLDGLYTINHVVNPTALLAAL